MLRCEGGLPLAGGVRRSERSAPTHPRPIRRGGRLRPRSPGLRVVLYHHLSDSYDSLVDQLGVTTPPAVFEAHVERLARDYDIVSLDQVLAQQLPDRALLITFDDGYRSVLEVAGPALKRLGLPSALFISGAFLDRASLPLDNLLSLLASSVELEELETLVSGRPARGRSFGAIVAALAHLRYDRRMTIGDELAERYSVDRSEIRATSGLFLDDDDLALVRDFNIQLGNHTRSHVHCRAIVDEEAANDELIEHQRRLEELSGTDIRAFSYPYGSREDATPFVERVLAQSGHQVTFLVESRPNVPGRVGSPLHRVSFGNTSVSRLSVELELLPRLRALRDRFA